MPIFGLIFFLVFSLITVPWTLADEGTTHCEGIKDVATAGIPLSSGLHGHGTPACLDLCFVQGEDDRDANLKVC